jgi:Cof subfamily protein (haloacid dehalogenase superfamily)
MKKYEGYLIASDLDGTLINSEQGVSRQNIDAIASFIEAGGLFAIATGRTELTALPFIEQMHVNCPSILYNGAVIYNTNSNTYVRSVFLNKKQLLGPLKEILEKFPGVCMQIFVPGKIFIVSSEDNIDPIVIREKQPFEMACIDDITNEDWVKVLMTETNQTLHKIQQFVTNRMPSGIIHSVFSAVTYLELFASGVTKGSALDQLIELAGVERERVIAIGDYCNDIEMMKAAGLGVATANAHPLLKEAADMTAVSNDEHAVSYLINKILPIYSDALHKKADSHLLNEKDSYIKIPV